MESDFEPVNEVNGINLDHYFPYKSSFNTVTYVHKRFLKKPQIEAKKDAVKKKGKEKKQNTKEDKAISCDIKDSRNTKEGRNDSLLQQTIRFAKNIVPLVIPPSEGSSTPVFYTIKTSSKCKKKDHQVEKCEKHDDVKFEKKRSKKLLEMYKKEKKNHKESYSGHSLTNSSQSNTLDDININQSLSYTLSERSDKREKIHKNALNNKRKKHDSDKLRISESFAGLATELNDAGETKIKINLMNDKEKHFLSESIRVPVLDAIKDCMKEINDSEMKEDVTCVQRFVQSNSQKLDVILEKLTCIENYLANHLANTNARSPRSPKSKPLKASKLEQLGEDLMKEKEYSSEEELVKLDSNRQRNEVTVLMQGDRVLEDLGRGEIPESRASTSVGVRTDRRQPARFCWTDAVRKNEY